jgi:hypothetical protein
MNFHAELFHLAVKQRAMDAEHFSCLRLVIAGALEGGLDGSDFRIVDGLLQGGRR